jgi:hypothetical protein
MIIEIPSPAQARRTVHPRARPRAPRVPAAPAASERKRERGRGGDGGARGLPRPAPKGIRAGDLNHHKQRGRHFPANNANCCRLLAPWLLFVRCEPIMPYTNVSLTRMAVCAAARCLVILLEGEANRAISFCIKSYIYIYVWYTVTVRLRYGYGTVTVNYSVSTYTWPSWPPQGYSS